MKYESTFKPVKKKSEIPDGTEAIHRYRTQAWLNEHPGAKTLNQLMEGRTMPRAGEVPIAYYYAGYRSMWCPLWGEDQVVPWTNEMVEREEARILALARRRETRAAREAEARRRERELRSSQAAEARRRLGIAEGSSPNDEFLLAAHTAYQWVSAGFVPTDGTAWHRAQNGYWYCDGRDVVWNPAIAEELIADAPREVDRLPDGRLYDGRPWW